MSLTTATSHCAAHACESSMGRNTFWCLKLSLSAQISFLGICYPVLVVTYLGQAAWLTAFPDQVSSTFYASIPFGDGFFWVS